MAQQIDPSMAKLLSILRKARRASGKTQEEVAELLGKPQSWMSKIENGERELSVIDYLSLCKAINLNPSKTLEIVGSIL